MKKSKLNRIVSIPTSSLTESELKEATKEWTEGSKQLENLLWTCHKNGIKTSCCHTDEHLEFNLEPDTPRDVLKCMFSETEKFGNAKVILCFGGNLFSGADCHKTYISISSEYVLQADRLWENIDKAISEKRIEEKFTIFIKLLELHDLLKNKDCGLTCQIKISAYHTYEINFDNSDSESTTEYFSTFFDKLGLGVYEDLGKKFWYFKSVDKAAFDDMLNKICKAFTNEYFLEDVS